MRTILVDNIVNIYQERNGYLVPKIWGNELHLVNEEEYTVKVMKLEPGHNCSFHLHKNKKESFVLLQGELIIDFISTDKAQSKSFHIKEKFETITLEPMTIHSFRCPDNQKEETVFLECSTKDEASDSYRFTKSR